MIPTLTTPVYITMAVNGIPLNLTSYLVFVLTCFLDYWHEGIFKEGTLFIALLTKDAEMIV